LVAQWVANTINLVQRCVDQIVDSLHRNDAPDLHYIVEELAGEENPESDLYLSQIGMLREGYQAESSASDDCGEADDF
jgi:hypothetical protein